MQKAGHCYSKMSVANGFKSLVSSTAATLSTLFFTTKNTFLCPENLRNLSFLACVVQIS